MERLKPFGLEFRRREMMKTIARHIFLKGLFSLLRNSNPNGFNIIRERYPNLKTMERWSRPVMRPLSSPKVDPCVCQYIWEWCQYGNGVKCGFLDAVDGEVVLVEELLAGVDEAVSIDLEEVAKVLWWGWETGVVGGWSRVGTSAEKEEDES